MQLTLPQWLSRIERLHPSEIELGLARVREVADRLDLLQGESLVITVAGTNGKGSCVAALDALLRASSRTVASYTSPHLLRYNERVRLNGRMVSDEALCRAFSRIEHARGEISLTYFEFGTLAALLLFREAAPDVIILETGLGGRLDAVNILDADLALISSIGLDHQEWLGENRDLIAREKAGIFRRRAPVICADPDPPASLRSAAAALDCPLYCAGREFSWQADNEQWHWQGVGRDGGHVALRDIPPSGLATRNVAAALQSLMLVPWPLDRAAVRSVLPALGLEGRLQWLHDAERDRRLLLDVSHNTQAAGMLAQCLQHWREANPGARVHAVLAMMKDKDHAGYFGALENLVDFWYIAQVDQARGLPARELHEHLRQLGGDGLKGPFSSVPAAYTEACAGASDGDTIAICGSFFTVSGIMRFLGDSYPRDPEN